MTATKHDDLGIAYEHMTSAEYATERHTRILRMVSSMTNRDLAEAAHNDPTVPLAKTFDYAIPQQWADDVHRVTGVYPRQIVWEYPEDAVWGRPYALTPASAMHIAIYNVLQLREREAKG